MYVLLIVVTVVIVVVVSIISNSLKALHGIITSESTKTKLEYFSERLNVSVLRVKLCLQGTFE